MLAVRAFFALARAALAWLRKFRASASRPYLDWSVLKRIVVRRVTVRSLAMEGIIGHIGTHKIHSLEAGIILIADGCDMTKSKAHIPLGLDNALFALLLFC